MNTFSKNLPYDRIFNFSAGPATLPLEVLEAIHHDVFNHDKSGIGVNEMSHRSSHYNRIHQDAINTLKDILQLPQTFEILLMHGGGTLQFACLPLNLLNNSLQQPGYITTGYWGQKAYQECQKFASPYLVADTKHTNYSTVPSDDQLNLLENTPYVHYCTNETIGGVQFNHIPRINYPLVADMSSDFCSRPIDIEKYSLIYAAAQKNIGIAGVGVVVIRNDFIGEGMKICPSVCSYKLTSKANSIYNTPPCNSIYVMGLVLKYIKQKGGLDFWDEYSEKKSKLIYDVIDNSNGFYECHASPDCRSKVNISFKVADGDDKLRRDFIDSASKKKLFGLGGHSSIGGCRASIYNGMPFEGVELLATHMKEFQDEFAGEFVQIKNA